jgi:hypothetical protein
MVLDLRTPLALLARLQPALSIDLDRFGKEEVRG